MRSEAALFVEMVEIRLKHQLCLPQRSLEHSYVTDSINLMNPNAKTSQCRLHILWRFVEFFPLDLHLCRSVAFSHSDQSILHAPPPVTEPLAVHVSRGGCGGASHFHNSAVCILSGPTGRIEQHYANVSSDTNKTVMAVNLQRGMGLQGGAPREMRFFLS
jgi:hypothetical protein